MSKTSEELKQLKDEYDSFTAKLKELTENELNIVTGGSSAEDHNLFVSNFDVGVDANVNFNTPENNNPMAPHFYHNDVDKNKFNN